MNKDDVLSAPERLILAASQQPLVQGLPAGFYWVHWVCWACEGSASAR